MRKLFIYLFLFTSSGLCFAQSKTRNNLTATGRTLTSTHTEGKAKTIQAAKMNIVFFLVDDLGWSDVGMNGSTFYETPNIDKFAKQGVRFTQAYAACHVCSPSRGSILSGQYPARTGLTDWLPGRKNFPFQRFLNVRSVQHMPYNITSLPKALKANGYSTAIIGKWHLGEDSASTARQGFDLHIPSGYNKGWPNNTYFSPYGMPGLVDGPKGEYLTDRMTTEALKYMEQHKNGPFFLYLAHFGVHDPVQGRPDLVKKYEAKLAKMHYSGNPYTLETNPDTSNVPTRAELNKLLNDKAYQGFGNLPNRTVKVKQFQDNVQFAAMVESVDESLGRVLAKLKELGIADNTIVVFVSDNGGMSAMNMGNPNKKVENLDLNEVFSTSNLPLRGGKGWFYEGGIREPMIVEWPGQTKGGTVCETPVIGTDFYPTFFDMLGLKVPDGQVLDGVSIAPLLKGKPIAQRALYWHFPAYSNHGLQSPGGAIRYGDYKLLEYFENYTVQLFNIKKDPGEQNDLAKAEPAKAKELTDMLHAWRKKVGAKMMVANPDYTGNKK